MTNDVTIFSCDCWSFLYILWRNSYWSYKPIFFLLVCLLLLSCWSSLIFLILKPYQICDTHILSPTLWVIFLLSLENPLMNTFFHLHEIQLIYFLLFVLLASHLRNLVNPKYETELDDPLRVFFISMFSLHFCLFSPISWSRIPTPKNRLIILGQKLIESNRMLKDWLAIWD